MSAIRPPAVAGSFYPADAGRLAGEVRALLDAATPPVVELGVRMVIVPHAGYVYSGPVAATAYAFLEGRVGGDVLLLGPAHFARFTGLAISDAVAFRTPLGDVAVSDGLRQRSGDVASVRPQPHLREHSLEVQLPFLQIIAPESACLPVLTGDDDPETASQIIERAVADPALTVVVSTDLSHYLDHDTATRLDKETAQAIVALDEAGVPSGSACGRTAVRGAMRAAARLGWRCALLDRRTSGETAGDPARVVGYGAFALGAGG